jgi:gamma-glutamyltranspeptidase/glutathione hydrolase
MRKLFVTAFVAVLSFVPAWASQDGGLTVPNEPGFRGGVVAASHPLAAEAGAKMLREGGNAIDAAAAIQFALNVVEPEFSGIGGGGFMMVHLANGKQTFVFEGREKAPATADTTLFTINGANQGFTPASTSGQAVGVPGTLMVVATAVQRFGKKRLSEVMEPAIKLARDGFDINFVLAGSTGSSRTNLYEATKKVFRLPNGDPLPIGHRLVQEDLAKTLELIAEHGPKVFYRGEIAAAIVEAQKAFQPGGKPGLMTLEDLKDYDINVREPIWGEYRGYRIASMSPPSSGGLTMIQALKMIERFPMGDAAQGFGFGKVNTLHVMAEAMRIAWADRAVWMGDEDFVEVPKRGLLHPEYVQKRGEMISLASRIPGTVPFGDPWLYEPRGRHAGVTTLAAAEPVSYPGGYTTHFSVVDQWGNVVSYTTTIEAGWGTGIMVPGYGFMLNNELTDFNFGLNPHPRFGGPGANDVQGGKRPRSSMTPTILFKGDTPVAAFGSPGGATIINSVFNVLINLVDHKMTIKDAVEAPRISVTTAGNGIAREAGFDPVEIAKLQALLHTVQNAANIGNVNAILIDLATGRQYGAVDPTREGGLIGLPSRTHQPHAED